MPLRKLAYINGQLSRWGLWLSAAGLVVMTVIIGWQVWGRYVLNDTPHWSEQLSLFLMNYFILLAAAVGVRERFHIGLVFFKTILPRPVESALDLVANLLVGGFGAAMVWYGGQMMQATWSHVIPTLSVPAGASYLPFPIAGALIVLFSVEHILNDFFGAPEISPAEDSGKALP